MPAISHVVLCALTELAVSIAVGLPLSRLLAPTRPGCVALAPALGWGVFNALALPLLTFAGFSRTTAGLLAGSTVLAGLALWLWPRRAAPRQYAATIPSWVVVPAAFLAILPALALWPKPHAGGILLSAAMFDHSKAAIVDEIVRQGLPPGNPFLAGAGPRLVYYYLWHFSAALPALHQISAHGDCRGCHVTPHAPPRVERSFCTATCHVDRRDHQPQAQVCNGCHVFRN